MYKKKRTLSVVVFGFFVCFYYFYIYFCMNLHCYCMIKVGYFDGGWSGHRKKKKRGKPRHSLNLVYLRDWTGISGRQNIEMIWMTSLVFLIPSYFSFSFSSPLLSRVSLDSFTKLFLFLTFFYYYYFLLIFSFRLKTLAPFVLVNSLLTVCFQGSKWL